MPLYVMGHYHIHDANVGGGVSGGTSVAPEDGGGVKQGKGTSRAGPVVAPSPAQTPSSRRHLSPRSELQTRRASPKGASRVLTVGRGSLSVTEACGPREIYSV